jgi:hypothetical protein
MAGNVYEFSFFDKTSEIIGQAVMFPHTGLRILLLF